jgi:peptidase E
MNGAPNVVVMGESGGAVARSPLIAYDKDAMNGAPSVVELGGSSRALRDAHSSHTTKAR